MPTNSRKQRDIDEEKKAVQAAIDGWKEILADYERTNAQACLQSFGPKGRPKAGGGYKPCGAGITDAENKTVLLPTSTHWFDNDINPTLATRPSCRYREWPALLYARQNSNAKLRKYEYKCTNESRPRIGDVCGYFDLNWQCFTNKGLEKKVKEKYAEQKTNWTVSLRLVCSVQTPQLNFGTIQNRLCQMTTHTTSYGTSKTRPRVWVMAMRTRQFQTSRLTHLRPTSWSWGIATCCPQGNSKTVKKNWILSRSMPAAMEAALNTTKQQKLFTSRELHLDRSLKIFNSSMIVWQGWRRTIDF